MRFFNVFLSLHHPNFFSIKTKLQRDLRCGEKTKRSSVRFDVYLRALAKAGSMIALIRELNYFFAITTTGPAAVDERKERECI
jgi:hypothetical protein